MSLPVRCMRMMTRLCGLPLQGNMHQGNGAACDGSIVVTTANILMNRVLRFVIFVLSFVVFLSCPAVLNNVIPSIIIQLGAASRPGPSAQRSQAHVSRTTGVRGAAPMSVSPILRAILH